MGCFSVSLFQDNSPRDERKAWVFPIECVHTVVCPGGGCVGSTPVASALVRQSPPDTDRAQGRRRFLAIFSVPSPVPGRGGTHEGRDLPLGA